MTGGGETGSGLECIKVYNGEKETHGEISSMYKYIGALALSVGALVGMACGSSETATPAVAAPTTAPAVPAPTTAPPVAPEPTAPPQVEAVDPSTLRQAQDRLSSGQAKVGTGVGDRAPEFEISLTDGSLVSAAGLQESQRPAFLFFFSTT